MKQNWKGSALLAPLPTVMLSCGSMEESNIITVAWAGIVNTHPPMVSVSIRPTRHSYQMICDRGEFVLNLTPKKLVRAADFCGMYTGRKVDKFEACRLTKEESAAVAAPRIAQCPLSMECKVKERIPLGSHDLFLAEVLTVAVEESLLDASGKLCLERAELAAFAHGAYFALGNQIGTFGFAVKKGGKRSFNR